MRIVVSEEVIRYKTILLTCVTGSFGQEFVRQALNLNPSSIRIYSRGEFLQQTMRQEIPDKRLRFQIGDVRDKERLSRAMTGVDIVVHAAALKQVDTCEYNPLEAIKTNIIGAMNIVDCAIDNKVGRVLGISSDKAVHPINIYGATKLVMEKLFKQANVYGDTKFACVRLGNIWGSRGSVVQLWRKQLKERGEIELTDGEMTRFWMTQESAVSFSIKYLGQMKGGETYIPRLIRVKMKDIIGDDKVKIKVIGKRAGERMHERLMSEGEEERAEYLEECVIVK